MFQTLLTKILFFLFRKLISHKVCAHLYRQQSCLFSQILKVSDLFHYSLYEIAQEAETCLMRFYVMGFYFYRGGL